MTTKTVAVQLVALTQQYQRSMASATASTTKLQTATGAAGKSIGSVMGPQIAIAGAVVAGVAVKMALDWEDAFTKIAAVTDTSQAQVEQWKSQVLALAGETAQAPKELADALYFLASAGLDTADVMPALEASAKAAAVGLGETGDIARLTANAMNAYSESGLTAAQVTDTLVAAVREGTAEPQEFADALGRILPIASKAGISFDQVAASLSGLSNIGLDVNEGVTAMRGVLMALEAPGGQAAETLDALGISADDVRASLREDGLIATLRLLEDATGGNIDTLRKIVPNVRALTGVFGLTGQEAEKVDEIFRDVADSTGSLGKAFETTAESDGFKLKQAFVDIQVELIKLGDTALPAVATGLAVVAAAAENARIKLAGLAAGVETDINEIESFLNPAEKMRQNLVAIKEGFIGGVLSGEQLRRILDKLEGTTVLSAAGFAELEKMLEHTRGGFQQGASEADRYRGGVHAVGDAATDATEPVGGLGDKVKDTADQLANAEKRADGFSDALDRLTKVAFDVEDAQLDWHQGLIDLREELKDGTKDLSLNTQAGIDNREALKDQLESALAVGVAMREKGKSEKEATAITRGLVAQVREEAIAAGFTKEEVEKYIHTLHLTPKQIRTIIANNAPEAGGKVDAYTAKLNALSGRVVRTYIETAFTEDREGGPAPKDVGHSGGVVGHLPRYHSGGRIKSDERVVVARVGETIRTRAQEQAFLSAKGVSVSGSAGHAGPQPIRVGVRFDRRRFTTEYDRDATYSGRWS